MARAGKQDLSTGTMHGMGEKGQSRSQLREPFERAVRALSFLSGSGMQAYASERAVSTCIDCCDLTERDSNGR